MPETGACASPESKLTMEARATPLKPVMTHLDPNAVRDSALAVITAETRAIEALRPRIDQHFISACQLMRQCTGRVVVTGMGKSGHIGRKIAATLASTGTPSFFVHSGDASHGDLGMITREDVVLALSHSGKPEELLALLPPITRQNTPHVAAPRAAASTPPPHPESHLAVEAASDA